MDLRSFKLHRVDRHLRAVLADAAGERGRDLEGDAIDRITAAAAPLLAGLAERAGAPIRALSLDEGATLRATTDDGRAVVLRADALAPLRRDLTALVRAIGAELRPRSADPTGLTPSDAAFWEHLYARGGDGWELGRPAPPLARHFEADPPRGLRALVVGCGRGHEARLLARLGARVTAIDLAAAAIDEARRLAADDPASPAIDFQQADLFDLRGRPPAYDLVVEHTCFCAIDPARRADYAAAVADALVPGGALVGLFYVHERPAGPPFATREDELRRRFGPYFEVLALAPAEGSVHARAGEEALVHLRRRAVDLT